MHTRVHGGPRPTGCKHVFSARTGKIPSEAQLFKRDRSEHKTEITGGVEVRLATYFFHDKTGELVTGGGVFATSRRHTHTGTGASTATRPPG